MFVCIRWQNWPEGKKELFGVVLESLLFEIFLRVQSKKFNFVSVYVSILYNLNYLCVSEFTCVSVTLDPTMHIL